MFIFASDFDGTLNRDGVSEANRDAIRRFRQAGNLFGIVTGRDHHFLDVLRDIELDIDFVLIHSGSTCLTPDGAMLYQFRAPAHPVVPEVVRYMGVHSNTYVAVGIDKSRLTFHSRFPDGDPEHGFLPLSELDKIDEFAVIYAIGDGAEDAVDCTAFLAERYGSYINPQRNGKYIDIPPAGVDKAVGLARYAALKGVPEMNVRTAGDNLNDMPMIRRFRGFAVENAQPELKAAACGVYPDVAAMLDELMNTPDET